MPPKKFDVDVEITVRSSRFHLTDADAEAFAIVIDEVTFRKENDARLRMLKEREDKANDKETTT